MQWDRVGEKDFTLLLLQPGAEHTLSSVVRQNKCCISILLVQEE